MTNTRSTGSSTDFILTLWIMRLVGATHGKYEHVKRKSFYYLMLMYNLIIIFVIVVFSLTNSIFQPLNESNMESYGFSDITVYYFYCAYNAYYRISRLILMMIMFYLSHRNEFQIPETFSKCQLSAKRLVAIHILLILALIPTIGFTIDVASVAGEAFQERCLSSNDTILKPTNN